MRFRRVVGVWIAVAAILTSGAEAQLRVGEDAALRLETAHPYRGPGNRASAQLVRSETVRHPGASYIAIHFERFQLAPGDFVVVRSPDGAQSWSYEGLGRGGLGLSAEGFWATHIKGDTAILELHSRHARGEYGFAVDRYAHGYEVAVEEPGFDTPGSPEAICGTDDSEWAPCYATSEPEIYERARAVARLLINGSSLCTGWLVGCEGHLITNNHCIGSAGAAANTDFEFMGEGATCQTNCFGQLACPGQIEATSSTLVQTNVALDYTLVKLPTNITPTYGFLTLRDSGAVLNERIYIPQHAAGWGKRISVFSTASADESGFAEISSLNAAPCTGGPGDIGYFADTQGGSSGSPVLAYDDHRVVSLHHCANCPNRGLDITDVIASLGGNLPPCALSQTIGTVNLDAAAYACDDAAAITVKDDSIAGQGSETVEGSSDSEGVAETITLIESAQPGTFEGTVALSGGAAVGGDGFVSVSDGDTLSVVYVDADDGLGGTNLPRLATAAVDCAAPQISGLQVTGIGPSEATIGWQTDEPADSRVTYGTAPPGGQTAADATLSIGHAVALSGLAECTEHFFSVASQDGVGNVTTDDNGGALYTFETVCIPPPTVPDGTAGTAPVRARRLETDGSRVQVSWDNATCPPKRTKILYGPLDEVATYQTDGALCNIPGFANPKVWNAVPSGDLWFLLVSEDGFGTESSWGESTAGERNGTDPSGTCGAAAKDLAASCP